MSGTFDIDRPDGRWRIGYAFAKLRARGALPGAYGYDLAAATLRQARAAGVPASALLAPAMPGSWMVNAKATSRAFRRWLSTPLDGTFRGLVQLLGDERGWSALSRDERARAVLAVETLIEGARADGGSLAAISKVLALVCPDVVPLCDDAAIWYALGAIEQPHSADSPTAGPEHFAPMLDWFSAAVTGARAPLEALASRYDLAPLSAAQVLDRLMWFESWGHRHSHANPAARWWWVRAGEREGIVLLDPPHPELPGASRVDLDAHRADAWAERARAALDLAYPAA
jgi:hypothetical protein